MGKETIKDIVDYCNGDKNALSNINLNTDIPEDIRQRKFFNDAQNWFDYFKIVASIENALFYRILEFESNIPVEVKLSIDNLRHDMSILNNVQAAKDAYTEDKTKRTFNVYENALFEHLERLADILQLYARTSII